MEKYRKEDSYYEDQYDRCTIEILKELEKNDIVIRNVFAEVPLKVEYRLSDYGKTLLPIIISLRQWGVQHLIKNPEIMSNNDNLREMISLIIKHEGIA